MADFMDDRKFQPSNLDNVESLELYQPGGFHPVHLGDTFADGRYRIIHKLGFGGFSTVWLAREESQKRYVALKILTAEASCNCPELKILQYLEKSTCEQPGRASIASILNYFQFEGPNGTHICLVSKVDGPSIDQVCSYRGRSRRLRGDVARRLARQAVQALAYLHSNDIVHGDYTTSNILLQLDDIDNWSEQDILHKLGHPIKDNVITISGPDSLKSAPTYLMEPAEMSNIDPQWLRDEIRVIDFGQSFFSQNPPSDGIGTPFSYRAPEAIFDLQASIWSDIWALGCTMFEIRSGTPLFPPFFGNSTEILRLMVQTFGKLPEPWWSAWDSRYAYFDDQGKPKQTWKNDRPRAREYPLVQQIIDIGTKDEENGDDETGGVGKIVDCKEDKLMEIPGTKLTNDEVDLFKDLLTGILKYAPNERLTMENIVTHDWFLYQ